MGTRRLGPATSNQGLGACIWWPNKDLIAESNGRLESRKSNDDGTTTYTWFVSSPINNYSIEVNAGS